MKQEQITIYKKIQTVSVIDGSVTDDKEILGNFRGIILPIETEAAKKKYGIIENVSHQFFYKGRTFNENIKAGNLVDLPNGLHADIVHIANFVKLKVVLLREFTRRA